MQPLNPFQNNTLRCFFDKNNSKWWFSAVDIYAILIGKTYDDARRYWNRFKREKAIRENQLIRNSYQLKLPSKDGKYKFTDVLDIRQVIYLIQITPSKNADPYRLWLADLLLQNTNIEAMLAEVGALDAAEIIAHKESITASYELQTIERRGLLYGQ